MNKLYLFIIVWISCNVAQSQTVEQLTGYWQFDAVSLSDLTVFQNKLYFFGKAEQKQYGLLSSDGLTSKTTLIRQFDGLTSLIALSDRLIFFNSGNQLWQSNGTEAGTSLIRNLSRASDFKFVVLNNKAYFAADSTNSIPAKDQLWVTDGTSGGTKMVKAIFPGGAAGIRDLTAAGGKLYFSAYDGGGNGYYMQPWVSDGTTAGTFKLKTVKSTKFNDAMPRNFTSYNNKVYFSMYDDESACQLWVTDGTPAGTVKFSDSITSKNGLGLYPTFLLVYNSKLYFAGSDEKNNSHLWKTDGTRAGTKVVKSKIAPTFLTIYKNKIYMSASDSIKGRELWLSDGTTEGSRRVSNYRGLSPGNIFQFQDKLIMIGADTLLNAVELFVSDGTDAGTICPKPPAGGDQAFVHFQGWVPFNNSVYFRASYGHFTDYEICRFTPANTIGFDEEPYPNLSVFPNPSHGIFNITPLASLHTTSIEVYSIQGELVYNSTVSDEQTTINLTTQPPGIYLVKVVNNNKTIYSQKIIKQ